MLNFDFLEKGPGIVSPPHFVYDFSKCFLSYILLTDQVSLLDCLYFLRYWSICVFQLFVNRFKCINFIIRSITRTLTMFNTMMENDRKGQERERDRKEKEIEILAKLVFSFSIIVFNMIKLLVMLLIIC